MNSIHIHSSHLLLGISSIGIHTFCQATVKKIHFIQSSSCTISTKSSCILKNTIKPKYIMCGSPTRKQCPGQPTQNTTTRKYQASKQIPLSSSTKCTVLDIEELHTQAVRAQSKTYIDPGTGFTVFTEYAHLKRGKCCGNVCRHCPYGWENVSYKNKNGESVMRKTIVKSGDKENVQIILDQIENGAYFPQSQDAKHTKETCNNPETNNKEASLLNSSIEEPKEKIHVKGKGGRKGGSLTAKNVPYTRTGDSGSSMLLTGERRSKDDISFEAMGTVDELCSVVGMAHAELVSSVESEKNIDYGELSDWLLDTMSRLFDVGSHVAKPQKHDDDDDEEEDNEDQEERIFTPDGIGGGFDEIHIAILEEWIDLMTEKLPELTSFILPTGGKVSAQLHIARCVCRRAERRILPLVRDGVCDPNTIRYLNRLSDFFFTAARFSNYCEGKDEVQYRRYFRGANQRGRVTVNLREDEKKDER